MITSGDRDISMGVSSQTPISAAKARRRSAHAVFPIANLSTASASSGSQDASLCSGRSRGKAHKSRKSRFTEHWMPESDTSRSLDRQIQVPLYIVLSLVVAHLLSSSTSLSHSLSQLSSHLPQTLQVILPSWARHGRLASFTSELPNASHKGFQVLTGSWTAGPWPFRSDAAGFGHPLSALHTFTRACLGLSYPVQKGLFSSLASAADAHVAGFPTYSPYALESPPWAFLFPAPQVAHYTRGWADAFFVVTWTLLFTAFRAAMMKYVIFPIGSKFVVHKTEHALKEGSISSDANGSRLKARANRAREKDVLRFAEQGWTFCFYVVYWTLGLYVASGSDFWPLKTLEFFRHYPHVLLTGTSKFYYLTQCAFWFHQVFVLNVEARRKDHYQMLSHHIITITLVVGSYMTNFQEIGNAIICLMDPSDILLAFAKMLKYTGLTTMCDVAFGAFMLAWIITRHVLFMLVYVSILKSAPHVMEPAEAWGYGGNWYSPTFRYFWLALLGGLQVLLCIWFVMICKVAWRVLAGGANAEDDRSDVETDWDEDESATKNTAAEAKED